MQMKWNGSLFNSAEAMADAIAFDYFTAFGANKSEFIDELLRDMTPADCANECSSEWSELGVTSEEMEAAFVRFSNERPDAS